MGQTKGEGLTSETFESQVIEFFGEKMNETVAPSGISACRQLPTTSTQKKNSTVKFTNRKTKDEILWNGRLLKGSQVYVNEHLTKKPGRSGEVGPRLTESEKGVNNMDE